MIRTVAEFVNFEVQYVGHQCGPSRADWSDANLFYWQISFPFLSVLLCGAWWLLRAGLSRLQHTRRFRALFGIREEVEVKTVRVVKNKSALASVSHTSANLVDYVWIKFLMFFVTWCAAGICLVYGRRNSAPRLQVASDCSDTLHSYHTPRDTSIISCHIGHKPCALGWQCQWK